LFSLGQTGEQPVNGEEKLTAEAIPPAARKPWAPPLVILSELRSTDAPVGKNPMDKNTTDQPDILLNPDSSQGS
jgi:hypothetical protein